MKTRTHRIGSVGDPDPASSIDIDSLPVAVLVVDAFGIVVRANERATDLLGRPAAAMESAALADLLGRDLLWTSVDGAVKHVPILVPRPSGERVAMTAFVSALPVPGQADHTTIVLAPVHAVDDVPSTAPRVRPWPEVADRIRSINGVVLCAAIGITGLQSLNQSFSRSTGDLALAAVANRLLTFGPTNAVVERISGNRFAVAALTNESDGRTLDLLLDAVREPIDTPLGRVAVGCSIGATVGRSRHGLVLIDRADRNLTQALRRGAGTIEWNDEPGAALPPSTGRLAGSLRDAVDQGTISAHFQPVVDLITGEIVEVEAFARWDRPPNERLSAAEFIDAARDTGAIVQLGAGVLREALDLCKQLRARDGMSEVRASVNASAQELSDKGFVARVAAELQRCGLPADALQIEISDTLESGMVKQLKPVVDRLRSTGVRVALDSFGGTSANLLALRDLHVDVIKLDPGLIAVSRVGSDQQSWAAGVLSALLELGRHIGVDVVAKGVEFSWQHELLRELDCHFAQGFLYGAPQPADELAACPLSVLRATDQLAP